MIGYKGFDKDLKCRGYQFEVGKDFEEERAELCKTGFHFCENPLDVFGYYPPADSRYCVVEPLDEAAGESDDSKKVTKRIRIQAEIGLPGLIKAGVDYILETAKNNTKSDTGYRSAATNTGNRSAATNTGNQSAATNTGDWSAATNTGYRSAATNTGDQSAATNTGDWSAATNTGYRSAATVSGKNSVAIATGREGRSRGALGCAIVVCEYDDGENLTCIKCAIVDGKRIKPNVYYQLRNGKLVAVEEKAK